MAKLDSFTLTYIISYFGMIASIMFLRGNLRPWGIAFAIVFFAIFISSLISAANVHSAKIFQEPPYARTKK